MMNRDLLGHYLQGEYIVLYEGDGIIEFSMDCVRKVTYVQPGKILLEIDPQPSFNNGIFLSI
jgi:hypothetical protein